MNSQLPQDVDGRIECVAALADPVRRALYRYVIAQPDAVGRAEAAVNVGVAQHVAKFHLDKLAAEGLLEVDYRRAAGRGGPGAGRPAKLYRRAAGTVAVSLPERRYDLAGHILATALSAVTATGTAPAKAVRAAATAAGRQLGEQVRTRRGIRRTAPAALTEALEQVGYEPRVRDGDIALMNCPFHSLAGAHTELVCAMNLELVDGILAGLRQSRFAARLDPADGRCCVTVARARG